MCDPLTIGGGILSLGSMAANSAAERKIEKARRGAMEAESIRQKGFDNEAALLNDQSRGRYEDFQGQQDEKARQVADFFKGQAQPLPSDGSAPIETAPTSSNVTMQETARQLAKAKAFGQQQDEALGNLRAFGDLLGGISREQARDAAQIGLIGGFKKGSQAVLPFELEAANNKGNGLKLFGDILQGTGMAAGLAGLSGAKLPFGGGSAGPPGMYNGGTGTGGFGFRVGGV